MSEPRRIQMHTLVESDRLCAWLSVGKGEVVPNDALIVVFSGIGRPGVTVPAVEFPRLATADGQRHAMFISDPKRSWLNEPGLIEDIAALIEKTAAELGVGRVMCMGHSMGGFMAAVMPAFTSVKVSLCFSPQATVHPDLIPGDKRWWEFRQNLTDFRIREIADHWTDGTRYFVVFGQHEKEANQVARLDPTPWRHLYLMPGTAHHSAARIKQMGQLERLIRFALQERPRMVREVMQKRVGALSVTNVADRDAVLDQVLKTAPQREAS